MDDTFDDYDMVPLDSEHNRIVQRLFFELLFTMLGEIARADGSVSLDEIQFADRVTRELRLTDSQKTSAQRIFRRSNAREKSSNYILLLFCRETKGLHDLRAIFLELLFAIAYSDHQMDPEEFHIIDEMREALELPLSEYVFLVNRYACPDTDRQQSDEKSTSSAGIAAAYLTLDLKPGVGTEEITKSYRRLMNRYHPDKIISLGLPEVFIHFANEKSIEIRRAYDVLIAEAEN